MRTFSKSKLMALRQCPKRLWLEIHRQDLREDSAATEASFQVGFQVGEIAQRIYDPEDLGALIDVQEEGFDRAFARSTELLNTRQPIFEAGFSAGGALAFADVMLPQKQRGQEVWHMVEVKSSTSVKDYHRDDVAVQAFIARSAGVPLASIALAHIDSSWVYPGDGDYRGLLKENDLTEEAFARSDEVQGWIAQAQGVAAEPSEPEIDTGDHCSSPFECGFYDYCTRNDPKPEYGEGKHVRLRFRIEKEAGFHLLESPLSADQEVVTLDDDYEITATVVDSAMLEWWLRGFGDAISDVIREAIEE